MSPRPGRPFAFADLPATIPVFPLPGVLLLPRGRLPLNIFEPRYLAMTEDAIASPDRLIGMIQPVEDERPGRPPRLYPTGCAGRITSFSETEDGRYLITLAGICRFGVRDEVAADRGYRRVTADFGAWRADLDAPAAPEGFDRPRFLEALRGYLAARKIPADWSAIRDTPDDLLIVTLAMICPFAPPEKQALLEARSPSDRARLIQALVEMGARAPGADAGPPVKH